jgi:hypothetical protein
VGVGVGDGAGAVERTRAVVSDDAVELELAFFAVTATRRRWPTAAVRNP